MAAEEVEVWLSSNGDYWKAQWRDAEGEVRGKSIGPKSKFSQRQARTRCREIARDLTKSEARAGGVPRLTEWLDKYARLKAANEAAEGTLKVIAQVRPYLEAYFDNDPAIDRITRADAADWLVAMQGGELAEELNKRLRESIAAGGPKRRAYIKIDTPTVRKHVRAARAIFAEAKRQNRIDYNPFDELNGTTPTVEKDWAEITQSQLASILAACPNDGWRNLFALCRLAALRFGEAWRLKWQHVDFDGNKINVDAELARRTTKKARRICPIEPAKAPTGLHALLEASRQKDGRLCHGVANNNIRRDAAVILKRAGVEVYSKTFHTLRKNRVTELALVYPQGVVEEWCGHDEAISRAFYQRVPEELFAPPATRTQIGCNPVEEQREASVKAASAQERNPLPANA